MEEEQKNITWKTLEHKHAHKDPDWFWGIGIIATSIAIISIIGGNPLFAVLIVIGAVTLFLHAIKIPQNIEVRVSADGILIHNALFSYEQLESFNVENNEHDSFIILKSKRILTPRIIVPLKAGLEKDARGVLLKYLKEEKLEVPISHRLLEFLGL
ncbi:MAG: hypothetical protein HYT93_02115 [Parcubacteria group bacterium]|nr:hypothetical protein [Parcubacteria group bacterium]